MVRLIDTCVETAYVGSDTEIVQKSNMSITLILLQVMPRSCSNITRNTGPYIVAGLDPAVQSLSPLLKQLR